MAAKSALLQDLARNTLRLGKALHFHNALSHASAVAFQFFLSFVPLLALVGFVLGSIVRRRGVEVLMGPVFDALPTEASQLVRRQLEGLAGAVSAPAAPLGVLAFFFVATTGTHHLMDVFEVMVGARRRPWWKQRSVAFAWVAGVTALVALTGWLLIKADSWLHEEQLTAIRAAGRAAKAAASAAASAASSAASAAGAGAGAGAVRQRTSGIHHASWERLVAFTALGGVALASLATLYRVGVEHPRELSRRVWPGAALALALGFIVSYAFAAYAPTLGRYTAYYGGLAAVAVVLVWLYLTSLALLVGAELNAQLEGAREILRDVPNDGASPTT